jgi:hypothetical protein
MHVEAQQSDERPKPPRSASSLQHRPARGPRPTRRVPAASRARITHAATPRHRPQATVRRDGRVARRQLP